MDARHLKISRPCPVDLDAEGVDRSQGQFYCGHCDKQVHVLSNMTRSAAREFVAANRSKGICVSYARDAEGNVRFAPEPALVPLASLRRRAEPRPPRRAAAAGLALALAACTPHGDGPSVEVVDTIEVTRGAAEDRRVPAQHPVQTPTRQPQPEPPEMIEGELAEVPELVPEDGELDPTSEVPCEPKQVSPKAEPKRDRMVRGRLKRRDFPAPAPKPVSRVEDVEMIDGMLEM